jgi:hypothetical protein
MLAMNAVTTPSGSRREARLARHRRMTVRRLAVGTAVVAGSVLGLLGAVPASAYWQSAGSGAATVSTGTLAAPTGVTAAAVSGTSVAVGWTASVGSPAPAGYFVTRTSGSTTVAACGTSKTALVTGTSCTDSGVPAGPYTYTVTAVYRSWTAPSAASGSVTVAVPSKLTFATAPLTTSAGTGFAVTVAVQSASDVTLQSANVPVTLALAANPASGTLAGTTTATTNANGVASFTGLSINKSGTGYTLLASSLGLTSATSPAFNIIAGAAATLAFTTPAVSGGAAATATIGPLTLQLQDVFGNVATNSSRRDVILSSTSKKVAIFSLTSGGPAITTLSIPATSSTATFYYGDTAAGSPTITASAAGLGSATQLQTINAGAPKLWFVQQPSATKLFATMAPAVTVKIADAFENLIDVSVPVSIAISAKPNNDGALTGSLVVNAENGLASFADLSIVTKGNNGNNAAGPGYMFQVSSPGMEAVTSVGFDIAKK